MKTNEIKTNENKNKNKSRARIRINVKGKQICISNYRNGEE